MKLLAISGSLRLASLNTLLLQAAIRLAPKTVDINLCEGLADLPLFNPDIEGADFERPAPPAVVRFRQQVQAADGLIIASPEYAHGVTGVMKNALDWIVGSGELVEKPVALLNASGRATLAYVALQETIGVMDGRIIDTASITIPLIENRDDIEVIVNDPQKSSSLHAAIVCFADAIQHRL